jgi:isopentenyl-diphosphate delta-isomerase
MNDRINERKLQHIQAILEDPSTDRRGGHFDALRLTHRALPEVDLDRVDPSVTFFGKRMSFPLLISSMTGGDHEMVQTVNRNLALAAETAGVAMGVGSQRVMFVTPAARQSFALRSYAPSTVLLSNLGAIQLNNGFDAAMCQDAIDVVGADGIFLHLNPLQECVQERGNTNFAGLAGRIAAVAAEVDRPVIVKEVGAGLSVADARLLVDRGVRFLDVAGTGGTSWSRIESIVHAAPESRTLGRLFEDWGVPTPRALMDLAPLRGEVTLIASGGIRSGIDMAKAVILGATMCGLARPFLRPAMESPEAVLDTIEALRREFVTTMFLLGMETVEALWCNAGLIVSGGAGSAR